jgi:hypothetical protein
LSRPPFQRHALLLEKNARLVEMPIGFSKLAVQTDRELLSILSVVLSRCRGFDPPHLFQGAGVRAFMACVVRIETSLYDHVLAV